MLYEITFSFNEDYKNLKTIEFPTEEQANRAFDKVLAFARKHKLFCHINLKGSYGAWLIKTAKEYN